MNFKCLVNILVGLPASGKTTFANKLSSNIKNEIGVISYENLQLKGFKHFKSETLKKELSRPFDFKTIDDHYKEIILDGLFLDTNYIQEIILRFRQLGFINFKLTVFEHDKEKCLKNDTLRRINYIGCKNDLRIYEAVSCSRTILNNSIPINIHDFCKINGYQFQLKEIETISDLDLFVRWLNYKGLYGKYSKDNEKIPYYLFKIDDWCLGGTSGSCYDDNLEEIAASDEPLLKNSDLYKVLKGYAPLKSLESLVYIYDNTFSEGDYYGGVQDFKVKVIETEKLFELFKRYNKFDWRNLPK